MKIQSSWFAEHSSQQKELLSLLDNFQISKPLKWEIDWNEIESIVHSDNNWRTLPIYSELLRHKNQPSIYYFSIDTTECEKIYKLFVVSKQQSSKLKIEKGLKGDDFYNISHVPKNYLESKYLYVGSRKKDVHSRFKEHLGYGPRRTGSLHIAEVFKSEKKRPNIAFYCHLLDFKYVRLTEHIEYVVQKHFNPLIGRHSF